VELGSDGPQLIVQNVDDFFTAACEHRSHRSACTSHDSVKGGVHLAQLDNLRLVILAVSQYRGGGRAAGGGGSDS
jgi:hypothetical protein